MLQFQSEVEPGQRRKIGHNVVRQLPRVCCRQLGFRGDARHGQHRQQAAGAAQRDVGVQPGGQTTGWVEVVLFLSEKKSWPFQQVRKSGGPSC